MSRKYWWYLTYPERLKLRRRDYKQQDKPIYLWEYDEESGVITKHEPIIFYDLHKLNNGDGIVYYSDSPTTPIRNTRLCKFDRCVTGKLYSFSDDDKKAVNAIKACMKAKLDKAEQEFKRYTRAYNKLLDKNWVCSIRSIIVYEEVDKTRLFWN